MRRSFMTTMILIFAATLFSATSAEAIPAFARKYQLSCSSCHVSIPKLKEYGEDFAGNGFLLPDGEEPKRSVIDTGDDELLLLRELPLAIRFDAFFQVADRTSAKSDFQAPYGVKLLSGGPISKKVSYYFYFYINERGEVTGLEDAFVYFNNLAKKNFDLMVGQFQVSDPLFKRELRLTFEDYQIYRTTPGLSEINLTYDRGLMATFGFEFGLDLAAQVLNGNGIGPARDRLFDFDNRKNFAFRASQSLGMVRLGGFAYIGSERSGGISNNVTYFGPDVTISQPKWELNLQFLHRDDDNPFLVNASNTDTNLDGGFVELIYMPQGDRSRWILTGLYNRVDGPDPSLDYESVTLSISHLMARNLRLLGELTQDLESDKPRFTLGFVSAF